MLDLPDDNQPRLLLDLGCGSGLSGEVLTEHGHQWVGLDISESMLAIANNDRSSGSDLMNHDLGQGLPFRPGAFDGAISISVIQWLCNADKSCHNPKKRLEMFFSTLFAALSRGSKCVFQFYPENTIQIDLITTSALKCGFCGGVVIDNPHSKKAKKYYLVLFAGYNPANPTYQLPASLDRELGKKENELDEDDQETVKILKEKSAFNSRGLHKNKKGRIIKDREWILHKKDLNRRRGNENVPLDSKYTGRKRRHVF